MNYNEYSQLLSDGFDFGIDASLVINEFQTRCAVNDLVALRLTSVSPKYAPGSVTPIVVNSTSNSLADLVVCSGQGFEYGMASAYYVAAYLEEVSHAQLSTQNPVRRDYHFNHSYIIVSTTNFNDYVQHYRAGSGIWGSFLHPEEQALPNLPHRTNQAHILASPNLKYSTPEVKDLVFRAVAHASPLERFLKLYHLLELNFDLQMVNEIKDLGSNLKGIGKILKTFNSGKEFDRLLKIVRQASDTDTFFEEILKNIFSNRAYHSQITEMLFEYEKDSNPYSKADSTALPSLCLSGFSLTTIRAAKLNPNYDNVSRFVAYIIYRFRCSIAHAKIGEYLLTADDEGLICEVAEPAIITILTEIYKK